MSDSERIHYTPVKDIKSLKEKEFSGVGCTVVVVNQDGKIFVGLEKDKGNEVNVLTETRKEGEFIWQNVLRALVEEMGVEKEDLKHFYYAPRLSYCGRFNFPQIGEQLVSDLVVIYYDGNNNQFHSRNEIEPLGFRNIQEVMRESRLRRGIVLALNYLQENRTIEGLLERVSRQDTLRQVFPSDFYPDIFFEQRKSLKDLRIK